VGFQRGARAQGVHGFALVGRILGDGRVFLGCYNSDLRSRLKINDVGEIMI
jgi:hypothetical protein